ncbi:hypothetical protein NliqN6_5677 [Naganishia liquefaciens]|uniref:Gfo/Idh/MocA family oxidoreductase n=1 Tax=Naganishia liquefaciens TaxID=104408 RepID=A0A8H3YGV3_9TREE|nr:hypothetical protein NliqN6_5677 [Naganishia liquefaciens]
MSSEALEILMCGTGEYTTGWTGSGGSQSDKKIGVVGLTMFDLRKRGKVGKLNMVGTSGGKFPQIREHLKKNIEDVYGLDTSFNALPEGDVRDPEAYKTAIAKLPKGSAVIIFTPDSTHYPIAKLALESGHHVMVTKPATQLLEHHQELAALAASKGLVCWVEHHKRYDPAYNDAKMRSANIGDFSFFTSYMSQPKSQLETFRAWAGIDSDISYYLNSHHIDIHCWLVEGKFKPVKVTASAATGIATKEPYNCVKQTEDTITLLVEWESLTPEKRKGTAVYTASWTAPTKSGVHSEQFFHYMGSKGEINVNQARRGYEVTVDGEGRTAYNPFYMKYSPAEDGSFDGQRGYGYLSFEKWIDAVNKVNKGETKPELYDQYGLPTIKNTILTTAIIRAGRISLDEKRSVNIVENNGEYKLE